MTNQKTKTLVIAALMAAFTTVATMLIRFPTPTFGYIHLGDGLVLLCGVLLGPGVGAVAAGIGSMLADLFSGYMTWVPGTLLIKAATAFVGGWMYHRVLRSKFRPSLRAVLAGVPAELLMVFGYFLYEIGLTVVSGSGVAAAAAVSVTGVPFNLVQGVAGVTVAIVLLPVLSHTGSEMNRRIVKE